MIELRNCLNLVEPDSIKLLKEAHVKLLKTLDDVGKVLPTNKGANRGLDCAVFKYLHEVRADEGFKAIDTIRSPFHEGGALYPGGFFAEAAGAV